MTISKIICAGCGYKTVHHSDFTTGYGRDNQNRIWCFDCCGKRDANEMKQNKKTVLYFHDGYVTNWPSTLKLKVQYTKESRHNFGGKRIDFWFNFDGFIWHGYQIGQYNEIAHCKQTKQEVA
jgi:hypothetical protein